MNGAIQNPAGLDPTLPEFWYKILVALLIGLLIGLERETKKKIGSHSFAGIRTFPLIAVYGFLAAFIAGIMSIYVYVIMFFVFGMLISISYYFAARDGKPGGTTEITLILVFILGSLVYWGFLLLPVAISVIMLIFLALKAEFRAFAGKIDQEDFYAAIKFAIITVIVLPLLPDKTFPPLDVFNPRKIWYMVVLIAGISF
ncbi:MAG: MgtC/SapB family protein, partial [Ignavibacteria bacterium]|nr:MgtC/SapB family protein [Ignavibacteria bacterium]